MSVYAMSNSILYFVAVLLLIEISNVFIVSRFPKPEKNGYCPFVSILIPARNEEKNIKACVLSLLNQKYDHYEVIVLNDNSDDKTLDILTDIAKSYNTLTILNGTELPQGWYGKHWACHQLSKHAKGEWLLFTDADTVHKSGMLLSCMALVKKTKPDLLTAFVKQHMMTFGEKITIPFPVWSIFTLLPMFIGGVISFAYIQCS